MEILRKCWTQDEINYDGEIYQISKLTTDPARPYQQNGGPLLYFGGYSPDALELCGAHCDVYLMWPETDRHAGTAHEGRARHAPKPITARWITACAST